MALGTGVHGPALFLMTAYALPVIGGHAVRYELLRLLLVAGSAGNERAVDILSSHELFTRIHGFMADEAVLGVALHCLAVAVDARRVAGIFGRKGSLCGLGGLGFKIIAVNIAGVSGTVPFLHGESGNMMAGSTYQLVIAHIHMGRFEIAAKIHTVAGFTGIS